MAPLPDPPDDGEYDDLISTTGPAYVLEWDSDNPGAGGGAMCVYPWRGAYFVVTDTEWTVYPSLRQAIEEGEVNYVTDATVSVESTELSAGELAGMLRTFDDRDYQIEIDGESYESAEASGPPDGPRVFRLVGD